MSNHVTRKTSADAAGKMHQYCAPGFTKAGSSAKLKNVGGSMTKKKTKYTSHHGQ